MADAARDQRETTLALRGGVEEPCADASGPLALVTTQQNSVTRSDPFEALEPPKEFSRDDVPRIAGESELQHLERCYILLAAQYEYALQQSRFEHNARLVHWREKEKALDDLETARKEIARLNEVRAQRDSAVSELRVALGKLEVKLEAAQTENARLHQVNLELVTARHDALLSEVARPKKRARVEDGNVAADEAKPAMQACDIEEAEHKAERLECDFLVTQQEIEFLGRLDRTAQEQNHLTRNGLGGVDAGGPGPGHYVEMAVLKGTVGKLEIKLAAAQKEIARLNQALQDVLRTRLDSAVAELAQKKRRRLDDDAAANQ